LSFLVPFTPSQPLKTLKSGDIYLKSIDEKHRRFYEKFVVNDNTVDNNEKDNNKYVQQLYVSNKY
jgi:hypothetical protein